MDFLEGLRQFSARVEGLKDTIQTEEATKTSLIMPFFSMLGYDVFNPDEFVPEYTADVGIKKGEKVDYAIMKDGDPIILIEAKWIGEPLEKHDSQLFRYFGTSNAKFGILTNGQIYRFFSDLDAPNKMDQRPFLEIDVLRINDNQVNEIKKFHKDNFDLESILDTASDLRYSNIFRKVFKDQLKDPSDDFARFFISEAYDGRLTQNVMDRLKPILIKTLSQTINDMMSDKFKSAIAEKEVSKNEDEVDSDGLEREDDGTSSNKIITTEEELEIYFIIKNMLKEEVPMEDINYRDTESYFSILYRNNNRKWICRVYLRETKHLLVYPDENKKYIKINFDSIYDIEAYKTELLEVVKRYM